MKAKISDQSFWLLLRQISKRTFWISLGACILIFIVSTFIPVAGWKNVLGIISVVAFLLALLTLLTWINSRVAFWWLKGPIRWGIFTPKVRRTHLLATYDKAIATARYHNLHLIRVIHVYQVGRRGTKCFVEHPDGVRQDAWFWYYNPKRGCVFMVRSATAYGPHNSNAHVMYIGSGTTGHGVVGGIPTAAWKAASKRQRQR